jgi:hypothetical protein
MCPRGAPWAIGQASARPHASGVSEGEDDGEELGDGPRLRSETAMESGPAGLRKTCDASRADRPRFNRPYAKGL